MSFAFGERELFRRADWSLDSMSQSKRGKQAGQPFYAMDPEAKKKTNPAIAYGRNIFGAEPDEQAAKAGKKVPLQRENGVSRLFQGAMSASVHQKPKSQQKAPSIQKPAATQPQAGTSALASMGPIAKTTQKQREFSFVREYRRRG